MVPQFIVLYTKALEHNIEKDRFLRSNLFQNDFTYFGKVRDELVNKTESYYEVTFTPTRRSKLS